MVHCAVDHFGALLRTIPCIQCTIPSTQHTIPKGAISPNSTYNLIRLIALMWGLPEVPGFQVRVSQTLLPGFRVGLSVQTTRESGCESRDQIRVRRGYEVSRLKGTLQKYVGLYTTSPGH